MGACEKIIEILKDAEALPFLFVGSGLSKRYINSESWENLLRMFAGKANEAPFFYEQIRERAKLELTRSGNDADLVSLLYPKIADYIEEAFNAIWYASAEYEEHRKSFADDIRNGLSPFKLEISQYCVALTSKPFTPENEIDLIKQLSSKSIAGIITTNYDCLMESLFPEFVPYVGQNELIFSNHLTVGEIYKIHGCCKRPSSIVINSKDYGIFGEKNAYLAAKLLTIFVEHPVIFLGYSINDENIRNILQAIVMCLDADQMRRIQDRLIFIEWDETKGQLEVSNYTINFGPNKIMTMTKIALSDFCELYGLLHQIKAKYPTKLLRQIKKDIYKLTLTTDPESKLVALNLNEERVDGEFEYVFGIGALEIGRTGFKMVTAERVYRDVVFDDDSGFINKFIVEDSLPLLMSRCGAANIPVYKYISKYDMPLPAPYIWYNNKTFDNFLTATLKTYREKIEYRSVQEIEKCRSLSDLAKLNYIAALPQRNIDVERLRIFLIHLFEKIPDVLYNQSLKSPMKKLIRMYDFLKYKN